MKLKLQLFANKTAASSIRRDEVSQTSKNTTKSGTTKISGVDQGTADKAYKSSFVASDDYNAANKEADSYLKNVASLANKTNIVGNSTYDALNSKFQVSNAYTEAMNYTNELLKNLSSGRTSHTDQIKDMMAQIQNRKDFKYDVGSDQLFQQAFASAMNSGKSAMQDTIGQASALTGGYGSTYATSAGNQAYNAFIEDAYNNLPEYYQMALNAYQAEGEEMYRQLAMFNDADAKEYQRMYDSWNANFANAQNVYNQEFGEWQANTDNAYRSANLQLQENSALFDMAYNVYNLYKNKADTMYSQEYAKWAGEVDQAQKLAGLLNSDAWNQIGFDEDVRQFNENLAESIRQFNENMTEDKRRYEENFNYQKDRDAVSDSQWERSFAEQVRMNNASLARSSASGGSGSGNLKEPTETQMSKALEAYNSGGEDKLYKYLDSISESYDKEIILQYVGKWGKSPRENADTYKNGAFTWLTDR